MTPAETPCARCGVVILAKAPRHAFGYVVHESSRSAVQSYHPGCWAAELRQNARA